MRQGDVDRAGGGGMGGVNVIVSLCSLVIFFRSSS